MERPAYAFILSFAIERRGDRGGVRVQFDHGIQVRPLLVDILNALQIFLDQLGGSPAGADQPFLKLGEAELFQLKFRRSFPG